MRKGQQTRQEIIVRMAVLFNEKGYVATTMRDISEATGLQRGGIYNHFASKEQLAAESFEYAAGVVGRALREKVNEADEPPRRLKGIATAFFMLYTENDLFPCGCPVLHTAIEAKRHMTDLRQKAREAMEGLRSLVMESVEDAHWKVDAEEVATIFIATLEGAMMLSYLYEQPEHLERAVRHLHDYVDHLPTR